MCIMPVPLSSFPTGITTILGSFNSVIYVNISTAFNGIFGPLVSYLWLQSLSIAFERQNSVACYNILPRKESRKVTDPIELNGTHVSISFCYFFWHLEQQWKYNTWHNTCSSFIKYFFQKCICLLLVCHFVIFVRQMGVVMGLTIFRKCTFLVTIKNHKIKTFHLL